MGNCFSDLEGGKQAVGAAQLRSTAAATSNNNNGGHNDAVEFFYRSRGLHPLFTQVEVIVFVIILFSVPHTGPKYEQFSQSSDLFIFEFAISKFANRRLMLKIRI